MGVSRSWECTSQEADPVPQHLPFANKAQPRLFKWELGQPLLCHHRIGQEGARPGWWRQGRGLWELRSWLTKYSLCLQKKGSNRLFPLWSLCDQPWNIREKKLHHRNPASGELLPQSSDLHRLPNPHMPQMHTHFCAVYILFYLTVHFIIGSPHHSLLLPDICLILHSHC